MIATRSSSEAARLEDPALDDRGSGSFFLPFDAVGLLSQLLVRFFVHDPELCHVGTLVGDLKAFRARPFTVSRRSRGTSPWSVTAWTITDNRLLCRLFIGDANGTVTGKAIEQPRAGVVGPTRRENRRERQR